jgi:hypothetical protein
MPPGTDACRKCHKGRGGGLSSEDFERSSRRSREGTRPSPPTARQPNWPSASLSPTAVLSAIVCRNPSSAPAASIICFGYAFIE